MGHKRKSKMYEKWYGEPYKPRGSITEERYLVCISCGAEHHGYPDLAEPAKCERCGRTKFQRMVRKTIPLKDWGKDSFKELKPQ